MATYKVIQDIEAEDKLVGPFSLRQFIYAGIVIVLGFINFQLFQASPFLALPLLLPMIFFGALSAPFGHDQSTEVWMLAKIRFLLKPRVRIWNQDGLSDLVTITAPKRREEVLTDGLSQTEVKSRLSALANTLDSRGWAVKNVNINLNTQTTNPNNQQVSSDRLVEASVLPATTPIVDITAVDDMMDEKANPTAQHLEQMIQKSEQTHRQKLVQQMQNPTPSNTDNTNADYWFMNQPSSPRPTKSGMSNFDSNPLFMPGSANQTSDTVITESEKNILSKIKKEHSKPNIAYGHTRTIQPLGANKASSPQPEAPKPVTPNIARLANNNDLNISTIAHELNRNDEDNEVVVSLH